MRLGVGYVRSSTRHVLRAPIDISLNSQPIAFGMLIDISSGGIGFDSSPDLIVGTTYLITIRDFGAYPCKIMHCTNLRRYGASFMISDREKRKLGQRLKDLPLCGD